jgi:NAD(P)-dependent dehydrogenase (short-subunit alcohol dehydrogenase family)
MNCKEKVAIVTGATGNGMGRSTALTLAREGAKVIVNYLTSQNRANEIVRHIKNQGGEAIAFQADIMQPDHCERLVEAAIKVFSHIDICIIGPGGGWHPESVDKLDSQAVLEDVSRELAPVYNLMPLVLPGMYRQKWGRIIGISLLSTFPSPSYAYNSGKAARTNALLLAHKEAWQNGVTVNVIAPGPVMEVSSLADAVELCEHGPKWKGRENVTPQDVAEGIAVLCSDSGRFVSGCELPYMFY